jgi:hypothetical protein
VEGRRNRLGLSYAGGTVVGDVIRRVRIDPAKGPCVVRMDWVRLRCLPLSGGETITLDFTGPQALEKLQMNGMRKIASGSYLVSGTDPNIVIDLRQLSAEIHTVFVECGFAALGLPASGVRRRTDPLKEKVRERAKRGRLAGPVRAAYSLLRRFG